MKNIMRQQLAEYDIQQMLGAGAVGTMYQAVAVASGAPVAVKLIDAALGPDAAAAAHPACCWASVLIMPPGVMP